MLLNLKYPQFLHSSHSSQYYLCAPLDTEITYDKKLPCIKNDFHEQPDSLAF